MSHELRAALVCRYSHSTDAGSIKLTGPALSLLSPGELREVAAFLGLIVRQAERFAARKEAEGVSVPLVADIQ